VSATGRKREDGRVQVTTRVHVRERERRDMSGSKGSLGEVRFLTVAEVAAIMRVSKMTVYRMVHSGTLPAIRVGRSYRVPKRDVDNYLREAFVHAG
jgi:excisionase family DNA binding protein